MVHSALHLKNMTKWQDFLVQSVMEIIGCLHGCCSFFGPKGYDYTAYRGLEQGELTTGFGSTSWT